MLNTVGRAAFLMGDHTDLYGANNFLLVHNPTEGFFKDLLESAQDKAATFGLPASAASKQFSEILRNSDDTGGSQWVAHSQGGIIFSESMRQNLRGGQMLSRTSVAFHAGGNNKGVTDRYASQLGTSVISYVDHPHDMVPQILGLRAGLNPLKWIGSTLRAPTLSGRFNRMMGTESPHTFPYEKN